jgi:photosynthetic reaction center cytochrome c subunit
MIHMSEGLGVNCTFCHNSRSFTGWSESTPQRVTAWHGIRMVRDLNTSYLEPLTAQFPANRLGPGGDVAKINCSTCHQGVSKPLYGAPMAKDYPELTRVKVAIDPAAVDPATADPAAADAAAAAPADAGTVATGPDGNPPRTASRLLCGGRPRGRHRRPRARHPRRARVRVP